jgi:Tfp pilus assembly protein PilN
MSVRVNLLPPEQARLSAERRRAVVALAALGGWTLLLVLLFVAQLASTGNTREQRDREQVELARLDARLEELAPYRDLARRLDARSDLLASAMAEQVSWSGVLNDLALVFPSNSSLLTLSASRTGRAPAAAGGPAVVLPGVGSVQFTGYSVERYAPGVESVLLGLDDAAAFEQLYLSTAARTLIQQTLVTNFSGSGRLTDEVYTHRFDDGLPEEER